MIGLKVDNGPRAPSLVITFEDPKYPADVVKALLDVDRHRAGAEFSVYAVPADINDGDGDGSGDHDVAVTDLRTHRVCAVSTLRVDRSHAHTKLRMTLPQRCLRRPAAQGPVRVRVTTSDYGARGHPDVLPGKGSYTPAVARG